MKTDTLNKLIEKAKTKKDGVYFLQGHPYFVKDRCLRLVGDYNEVFQFEYGFLVSLGKIEKYYELKNEIKRLGKEL